MSQFYYTYAYLREDRTPYYIGKGKGYRVYKKSRREFKPPKDKSRIIFLKQNLTEEEAFKHEKYMIALFGRKDNGTGILRNMTDGGEGASNQGTPEQRSEARRKAWAKKTPEQRSEATRNARNANSSRTPEQRSEATRNARNANSSRTPEQRSEARRKAWAKKTPEQRSETMRKVNASRTPEQRSETMRKVNASRTPKQRSEIARKAGSQKFQCTVTGFICNAGGLSMYQKARGIDTSNRKRIS